MAGSPWTNQSITLLILTEQIAGFSGIFGYSPTIGAGNLIFSVAAANGTDPYGNAYTAGVTSTTGSISGSTLISFGSAGGIFIYSGTPAFGNLIGSWAGHSGTDTHGNAYPQGINISQGNISGSTFSGTRFIINTAGIFLYSGTPGSGNLVMSLADAGGTDGFSNTYPAGLWVGDSGQIIAANVFADAGGYGGTAGTADQWHPISLMNGWTNRGTGFAKAAYRAVTSPPNGVEIIGEITNSPGVTGTSLIGTLPALYAPNNGCVVIGDPGGITSQLYAAPTGNLTFYALSTATLLQFHGLISLDAPGG